MTVTISTTGEHRHDQSPGQQTGGGFDKDDIATLSLDFSELPPMFAGFLLTEIATDPILPAQKTNATNYRAAHEDPGAGYFVNVATTQGEVIDDLKFSDANGDLFDGDVAQYNGSDLHVAGSTDPIYLYSFAGGDILIGSTEGPAGVDLATPDSLDGSKLVFAYYLQENGAHTGADIWGVTFQPLEHPDLQGDTAADHDDTIDFGDFLHVTATGKLSFDFDTLKSGKFLWVAVGNNDNGLLVTGKDLNVQDLGHAKEGDRVSGGQDPSDSMNTSQGGQGATMGVNDQMFKPGNSAVFTLVKQFSPLDADGPDATGDNVKQIDYGNYINTVGAGIFISQTQGNGTINMTIDSFEAGGAIADTDTTDLTMLTPEEMFAYIGAEGGNNETSGAFEDDWDVPVKTVTVLNAAGTPIGTWGIAGTGFTAFGTQIGSVKVSLVDGNTFTVTGISALFTVNWTVADDQTFNRFHVTANAGSEKFDIGRIDVDEGVKITESIGDDVIIHDDGPEASVTANTTDLALEEVDDTVGDPDVAASGETADGNDDGAEATNLGKTTSTSSLADLFDLTKDAGSDGEASVSDVVELVLVDGGVEGGSLATGLSISDGAGAFADDTITLILSNDGQTIWGQVEGDTTKGVTANTAFIISLSGTDANTATISLEHLMAIEHSDTAKYDENQVLTVNDLNDLVGLKLTRTVTDGDGDTAVESDVRDITDQFSFDDDGPAASVTANSTDLALEEVDDTVGDPDVAASGETADGNDDGAEATNLGKTTSTSSLADLFDLTKDAGSDGEASVSDVVELVLVDGGVEGGSLATGLSISDGAGAFADDTITLILSNDGQTIWGQVEGDTTKGVTANTAFIISLSGTDANTATISLEHLMAIEHSDTAKYDENQVLTVNDLNDLVGLKLTRTVTDGDGDTAVESDVRDITDQFSFDDDGPTASVTANTTDLALDEVDDTVGQPDAEASGETADGNADGAEATNLGKTTSTSSLADLFDLTKDAGSDGEASVSDVVELVLVDGGVEGGSLATGLSISDGAGAFADDTITLILSNDGQTIWGQVEGDTTKGVTANTAFIISLSGTDANTATISLEHLMAIEHSDTAKYDENQVLTVNDLNDLVGLKLTRTVTDGDGDTAVESDVRDITDQFSFDDDGPAASVTANSTDLALEEVDDTVGDPDVAASGETADGNDDGAEATNLGKTTSTSSLADLFDLTKDAGSDGEASVSDVVELVLVDGGVEGGSLATGLSISDGAGAFADDTITLILSNDGQTIWGQVEGDTTKGVTANTAFIISLSGTDANTATISLEHLMAIEHSDTAKYDENQVLTVNDLNDLVGLKLTRTVTDGDGDTAVESDVRDITDQFSFDDDGPAVTLELVENAVLALDESTDGDDGGGFIARKTIMANNLFTTTVDFGSDGPGATTPSYRFLDPSAQNGGVSGLLDSETDQSVIYSLEIATGDIVGTINAGATEVIRYHIDATTGDVTASQSRAIEHPTNPDNDETLPHPGNFTIQVERKVFDGDGDSATATLDITVIFLIDDDGPVINITGGGGQAAGGADGDLFVDFIKDSTDSALLGTDPGNDGTQSVTITDYSGDGDNDGPAGTNGADLLVNGVTLTAQLTNNGTLVNYFQNVGGDPLLFDDGDILYYTYELQDLLDADGLAGTDGLLDTAVFTVHDVPPSSMPDFSLNDLPSGQNGFGILASRQEVGGPLDPDGPGLVIFGREAEAKADGTFTNKSDTINTSKGGGPTTIGVNNQMIDPPSNKDPNGEGVYIAYINDPVDNYISGIPGGLTQGEADDFDNIQYNGTVETGGAFFTVVQTQGNPKMATARITTFDLPDDSPGLQGVDLVTTDFLNTIPAATRPTITEVIIKDAMGNIKHTATIGVGDTAQVDFISMTDDSIFEGSVIVSGILAGDTIEFKTLGDHDLALIEGLAGKFDIGDYGIDLFNPTPDQVLSFANTITDNDGDSTTDTHRVGIDGTGDPLNGGFNDDMIEF